MKRQLFAQLSKSTAVCILAFSVHWSVQAQTLEGGSLFDLTIGVDSTYDTGSNTVNGGTQGVASFGTVNQLFDRLKFDGLKTVTPAYNDNSAAVIRLGYRGLPMVIRTNANSPAVEFLVPAINRSVTFNSKPTRDGNVDDLKEYLKSQGGAVLNDIQRALARFSPIDPIAGNPNSLQSQMVFADFDRNFTQHATNVKGPGTGQAVKNLIGIGVDIGTTRQAGVRTTAITLPLSYTFRADIDPGRQVTVYAPITLIDTEGAKSVAASLGVAYRHPMSENWALTPAIGYGVTGSVDLGSAAALFAASLTSQYVFRLGRVDVAIGNAVGIYNSTKASVGDYSFDPQVKNTVFRNGIMASMPTMLMNTRLAYEVSYINTIFTGTDLYSKKYNELGITVGTNRNANNARTYFRAGLTYLQGQNSIKGLKANVGYWF